MKDVTPLECTRERDVLDAVASARWPDRMDRELSEHVDSCAICRDVAAVASAMSADHDDAWRDAVIPSSGQAWWRAEMRARQEAIHDASRPVAVAQGVAAILVLILGVTTAWLSWPSVRDYVRSLSSSSAPVLNGALAWPLYVAVVALAVIAPLALYLVIAED